MDSSRRNKQILSNKKMYRGLSSELKVEYVMSLSSMSDAEILKVANPIMDNLKEAVKEINHEKQTGVSQNGLRK